MKRCSLCHEEKDRSEFKPNPDSARPRALMSRCNACFDVDSASKVKRRMAEAAPGRCRVCDRIMMSGANYCMIHRPKTKCRNYLCEFPGKHNGFCLKHFEQAMSQGAE